MRAHLLRAFRRIPMPVLVVVAAAGLLAPAPAAADRAPTCAGRTATIVGTSGRDRLTGTSGSDVIVGLEDDDRIYGGGGNDFICGNGGRDSVYGGAGHDRIWGGPASDWGLYGDEGNDYIDGGMSHDDLAGGPGQDVLLGRTQIDDLDGGSGADRLYGGGGTDSLKPGRGRDRVNGGPARDRLDLTALRGGAQVDLASGGLTTPDGQGSVAAVEEVWGTYFADVLKGNAGRNSLSGFGTPRETEGEDRVEGRGGHDRVSGDVALGGAGNDWLQGRRLAGHAGDDRFYIQVGTWNGPVAAMGGSGSDKFNVTDYCHPDLGCSDAQLRLAGGDGRDRIQITVDYEDFGPHDGTYHFDLRAGLVTGDTGLRIHVRDFEEVVGTHHDDTIIGSDRPEYLMGATGDDTIRGWGGNDILAGGSRRFDDGIDTIRGGGGAGDVCYTSSPPHGTGPADMIASCETTSGVPVLP